MKNNVMDKVAVDTGKLPRSRFNKSFDVNTTADWGSLQPTVCQMMYPNTKNVVQSETLTRLAPMLAPTFGRINYKEYHQFVDIEDIFPPFAAMMSQTRYNGDSAYVPQCVPRVPLCILSLYAFAGAKMSLYSSSSSTDEDGAAVSIYNVVADTVNESARSFALDVGNHLAISPNFTGSSNHNNINFLPFDFTGVGFNAYQLLSVGTRDWLRTKSTQPANYQSLVKLMLPLGNPAGNWSVTSPLVCSFFRDVSPDFNPQVNDAYSGDFVDLESADYVVPIYYKDVNNNNQCAYCAFRFSNFGKRIRKALLGCGYQIDLNSREILSILPLMAYYKAYYDLFGLTSHANYADTELAKLVQHISFNNYADWVNRLFYTSETGTGTLLFSQNYMKGFLLSLGDCWYTENQDYISVHQSSTTYGPAGSDVVNKMIDIDKSILDFSGSTPTNQPYGQGFVKQTNPFTALDIQLLMRMYRWSNVNSVAGKQIAAALIAQGYRGYVESCKSNFIGKTDYFINVSDVVSMSDTYDGEKRSGSILGEYGGKGIGYDQSNSFVFETDKFGYWIGMFAIVPISGYNQGIDPTLVDTEKFDFYNPQFDGKGYQASSNSVVAVPSTFALAAGDVFAPRTFGFVPRYSEWKVSKNISNGDFSLKSTRNTYMPYCLDKELPIGERMVYKRNDAGTGINDRLFVYLMQMFKDSDLPTAGDVWRFVGRYPWIGTFDRIFANFDSDQLNERIINMIQSGQIDNYAPIYHTLDNFMIHQINHVTSYAPMKPIEESFGTEDENGSFDSSMEKA